MIDDNVLNEDLNSDNVLSDDSVFEDNVATSLIEEDEDEVDFESFDDSASDW